MTNLPMTIRKNLALVFLTLALVFLPLSKLVCHIAVTLYIVLWLTEGAWREKLTSFKSHFVLYLFTGWMLLTAIVEFSVDAHASLFVFEKKAFFFALPLCVATSIVKFTVSDLRILFYAFAFTCFGVILCCGVQSWIQWYSFSNDAVSFAQIDFLSSSNYFTNHPEVSKSWVFFTYIGLANGAHLHPAYFSLYIAVCVAFLLLELAQPLMFRFQRALCIFLIIIFLIGLVLLSSRIVLIGMTIVCIGLVVHELRIRHSRIRVVLVAVFLIMLVTGVFLNPISRHRTWKELTSMSYAVTEQTHYTTSSEIRASLWWLGWKSFLTVNPFVGAGASNVKSTMEIQSTQYQVTNVLNTYDPHNQFLFVLIANGIPGLVFFIAIIIIGFRNALRNKQVLFVIFLTLFTMMCVTESVLELQKGIVFFSLLFSLLTFQRTPAQTIVSHSTTFASA